MTDFKTLTNEARQDQTITTGTVPLNPAVREYAEADGNVVMYVRDGDSGRSLYLGIKAFGAVTNVYEFSYDDFLDVFVRMQSDVILNDAEDPYSALLTGGTND